MLFVGWFLLISSKTPFEKTASSIGITTFHYNKLENLDLLSGENHNEDDNFNITEIEENVNLISIDNLEDLLSNHNEISNTKSEDDIPNEITSLEDELQEIVIQEDGHTKCVQIGDWIDEKLKKFMQNTLIFTLI